jgi:hypothetical protein
MAARILFSIPRDYTRGGSDLLLWVRGNVGTSRVSEVMLLLEGRAVYQRILGSNDHVSIRLDFRRG